MKGFEQRESIKSCVYRCVGEHVKRRKSWRWVKQQANRYMRREAKQRLEDAPQRVPYSGYEF